MANFWQAIIDKVTGHNSSPNAAPIDISHVANAAAVAADPKVEVAQREAAQAEAEKQAAAAQPSTGTGGYEPPSQSTAQPTAAPSSVDLMAAWQQNKETAATAANEVAAAADQFEIIKEHTLTYDDTLSGLALHFYGHATPEYWGLIILANKNTIGGAVKDYTPGKVIKIPVLPDSMKK